ncbi:hypothetical protein BDV39DRAFT_150838 [Aspergillus sergii]|uniref:Secreted protein n=1 Tax=Aspergillus sergii TaxID=1034303 RepID=A0A5N6XEZ2_9EURO|nr:hypothetical protein BDV39DRAFT_150838 [Aspergillus sergii]
MARCQFFFFFFLVSFLTVEIRAFRCGALERSHTDAPTNVDVQPLGRLGFTVQTRLRQWLEQKKKKRKKIQRLH